MKSTNRILISLQDIGISYPCQFQMKLSANSEKEQCMAMCAIERNSLHRRETYYYHLGKKAGRLSIRDDFIEDIFPSMAVASAEDCLVIATPETPKWDSVRIYDAFTLLHDSKKIMYLRIPCMDEWHGVEFKESLLALLELAENVLKCDYLYVCLEKTRSDLANLVHAFLYVGFNVVPSPVNGCNTKYVFLAYGLK